MNSEFAWSIIIIFFSFILIGTAVGLYFYWKRNKEYKEENKIIVWSIAFAGGVTLVFGILLMIWSSYGRQIAKKTKIISKTQ